MSNQGLFGLPNPANANKSKGGVFNYANLDKDLSLSVADMGKTININTPNNYSVKLPDARQLTSALMTVITNNHTTQFINVKDNNGLVVKTVMPMQSVVFWATSKTTSGGAWIAKKLGGGDLTANNISVGSPTTVASVASGYDSICALSSTQAIAFYQGVSSYPTAHVLTAF